MVVQTNHPAWVASRRFRKKSFGLPNDKWRVWNCNEWILSASELRHRLLRCKPLTRQVVVDIGDLQIIQLVLWTDRLISIYIKSKAFKSRNISWSALGTSWIMCSSSISTSICLFNSLHLSNPSLGSGRRPPVLTVPKNYARFVHTVFLSLKLWNICIFYLILFFCNPGHEKHKPYLAPYKDLSKRASGELRNNPSFLC